MTLEVQTNQDNNLIGFGQSEMIKKGLITNYMDLIDDLKAVLAELDKLYPKELPRFLLGESMGGMVIFYKFLQFKGRDNVWTLKCILFQGLINLIINRC